MILWTSPSKVCEKGDWMVIVYLFLQVFSAGDPVFMVVWREFGVGDCGVRFSAGVCSMRARWYRGLGGGVVWAGKMSGIGSFCIDISSFRARDSWL
jgi:hypothetical protein